VFALNTGTPSINSDVQKTGLVKTGLNRIETYPLVSLSHSCPLQETVILFELTIRAFI
jgi:hypothetical protein